MGRSVRKGEEDQRNNAWYYDLTDVTLVRDDPMLVWGVGDISLFEGFPSWIASNG